MPGNYRPASAYGHAGPLESRLSGTGRLADDLWLLAHHEATGRSFLHVRQLGLGLAAGLLAELMMTGHPAIILWHDDVITIGPEVPLAAVSAHPLLRQIAAEPEALPVLDWLQYLSRDAAGAVAQRLEQAGYLIRVRRRIPGLPARMMPADRDWAFAAVTRVGAAIRPGRPSGPYGAVLGGLAVACGLAYRLDLYLTGTGPGVDAAVACLPEDLRQLIAQTQTAACAAVLSRT